MVSVEWRRIDPHNVFEFIGKTVKVTVDRLEGAVYSTLRVADFGGFTVDGSALEGPLSYEWDEAQLFYAWYPVSGNVTLTDPIDIKRFVEKMDEKGVSKYVR